MIFQSTLADTNGLLERESGLVCNVSLLAFQRCLRLCRLPQIHWWTLQEANALLKEPQTACLEQVRFHYV